MDIETDNGRCGSEGLEQLRVVKVGMKRVEPNLCVCVSTC